MVAINATSLGYAGSITEVSGAAYFNRLGASRFGVYERTAFQVTQTTGALMLRVNTGTAWGHNIVDTMHTAATLQLNTTANSQRWDAIVLRRNPTAGETTIEVVQGGTQKQIPALQGGTHPDQPIALARVVAGQSTVQEIIDLRVWAANGGAVARDEMVLGVLDADLGTAVEINGVQWVRRPNAAGTNAEWAPLGGVSTFHSLYMGTAYNAIGGASVTQLPGGYRRVDLGVDIVRTASSINFGSEPTWQELGAAALPDATRGAPIGAASNALQFLTPLYTWNTRDGGTEPNVMLRIVPSAGQILIQNRGGGSWWWRTNEAVSLHFSYFVR